jgi:hypothetical protein
VAPVRGTGGRGDRVDHQLAKAVPTAEAGRPVGRPGEAEPGHQHVDERDHQREQAEGQGRGQDPDGHGPLAPQHANGRVDHEAARPCSLDAGLPADQQGR